MSVRRRAVRFFAPLAPVLLALACVFASAAAQTPPVDSVREAVERAVDGVKPAIVRIHVVQYEFYGGRETKSQVSGSGVVISPEGHVVTNHHVAGNSRRIFCTLADKREVEADLVGTDALSDIAVVKLRGAPGETFPFAEFGDSSLLRVGDRVLSMGSPRALSQSVTMGIVSNVEMTLARRRSVSAFMLDDEDVGSLVVWIGHDAEIHPGNSGGPLVSLDGKIVGINEVKIGLSGAIPGNLARDVARALIAEGRVRRAWLGLEVQPLLRNGPHKTGVLVSGVLDGSPAEKAGFRRGDVVVQLAGRDVSARFPEEVPRFNALQMSLPVGEEAEAVVLRDGKRHVLRVMPEARENARAEGKELPEWGISASDMSLFVSKQLKRRDKAAVLVTGVRPGGPASDAKPPLQERDAVVEVNGKPVRNLAEFEAATAKITGGSGEPVPATVGFERLGEKFLTVVKVGTRERQDPGAEARKAWLGVGFQALTKDLAKALDLDGKTGVRVTEVYSGGPAEVAGLRAGDVLLAFDGESIPVSYMEEVESLSAMVRQYKIGAKASLSYVRDGKPGVTEIVLGETPKLAREMKKYRDVAFDFSARDIAFLDRVRQGWAPGQEGAYVESATEGGWASLGGLSVGDLVTAVDGEAVSGVVALEKILHRVRAEKRPHAVFQIERGIHTLFLEIEPRWDAAAPPK